MPEETETTQVAKTPHAPKPHIVITEELISDSIQRDSSHCMIAEAIKQAIPAATRVSVDLQTVRFSDRKKGYRYTYLTPRVAQVALVKFDQGFRIEPFRFRLKSGQVTRAGSRRSSTLLNRAKLAKPLSKGTVAERVGGKPPPKVAGKRRAFGLRGLEF